MPHLDYPFHFDAAGRSAQTQAADHVRDLVEQVLFTSPGERVMRPDFGAGVMALVFEPNDDAMAATTRMLVQASLQQNLAHLIALRSVTLEHAEGTLTVSVAYQLLADGSVQHAAFSAPGV
jgi:phage baseplate assembly protein W